MKTNSELKSLASLAKQRLLRGKYTLDNNTKRVVGSSYYIQNARALKTTALKAEFEIIENVDDSVFVQKVYDLLNQNGILINLIGQLLDRDYYDSLNEVEQQYYVFSLAEKYNRVKDTFYKTFA